MSAQAVVFDSSFLLSIFSGDLRDAPKNLHTGQAIERYDERVDFLLKQLEEEKRKILIPTPALSEILVRSEQAGQAYLETIRSRSIFRIVPFTTKAAIAAAEMTRKALQQGDKFSGSKDRWQKVKFDRQILAIAQVNNAESIYSNDKGLQKLAVQIDMQVISSWELPLPPQPELI